MDSQSLIHLEYSLTAEDLAEALKPPTPPGTKPSQSRGAIGWLIFVLLLGCCFALQLSGEKLAHGISPSPATSGGQTNLWITLAPPMWPVLIILAAAAGNAITAKLPSRRRTRNAAEQAKPIQIGVIAIALPLVFLVAIVSSDTFAISWSPTPLLAVAVAFAPWAVTFLLLALWGKVFGKRAARKNWERSTWLHRPMTMDASDECLMVDDGITVTRRRWAGLKRYRETENLLILTTEENLNVLIPKSAASDIGMLDTLYGLIQRSIPVGEFLPRDSRFQVVPRAALPAQPINID
jgi:hypothetical protein